MKYIILILIFISSCCIYSKPPETIRIIIEKPISVIETQEDLAAKELESRIRFLELQKLLYINLIKAKIYHDASVSEFLIRKESDIDSSK